MPNADWERAVTARSVLSLQELRQMVRKSAADRSRTAGVNGEASAVYALPCPAERTEAAYAARSREKMTAAHRSTKDRQR